MSNKAIIEVGLDEESKKLLNAAIKAAATLASAAAGGKGKPAGKGKAAAKEEPADDDADMFGDADDADADDGDADDADDGDADDAGEDDAGEDDGPTVDEVGQALQAFAKAPGGSKALAIKLLKLKGGTEKLSELKDAKFAAVIAAAKTETAKLVKAGKAKK